MNEKTACGCDRPSRTNLLGKKGKSGKQKPFLKKTGNFISDRHDMKKAIETICCFIVLPLYGFSCFGDLFLEMSVEEKALSYKEHRERQKSFQRERREAFSDYKREQDAYKTKRQQLRVRRQNQDREAFDRGRAGLQKKWNREQAAYQNTRRQSAKKYIERRDRHRKRNQTKKDLLEQIKPNRELVL